VFEEEEEEKLPVYLPVLPSERWRPTTIRKRRQESEYVENSLEDLAASGDIKQFAELFDNYVQREGSDWRTLVSLQQGIRGRQRRSERRKSVGQQRAENLLRIAWQNNQNGIVKYLLNVQFHSERQRIDLSYSILAEVLRQDDLDMMRLLVDYLHGEEEEEVLFTASPYEIALSVRSIEGLNLAQAFLDKHAEDWGLIPTFNLSKLFQQLYINPLSQPIPMRADIAAEILRRKVTQLIETGPPAMTVMSFSQELFGAFNHIRGRLSPFQDELQTQPDLTLRMHQLLFNNDPESVYQQIFSFLDEHKMPHKQERQLWQAEISYFTEMLEKNSVDQAALAEIRIRHLAQVFGDVLAISALKTLNFPEVLERLRSDPTWIFMVLNTFVTVDSLLGWIEQVQAGTANKFTIEQVRNILGLAQTLAAYDYLAPEERALDPRRLWAPLSLDEPEMVAVHQQMLRNIYQRILYLLTEVRKELAPESPDHRRLSLLIPSLQAIILASQPSRQAAIEQATELPSAVAELVGLFQYRL
jgi:hypothetical protein